MNILIVDDDEAFVRECSERLFSRSWNVVAAQSVDYARTLIRSNSFDVVLLDLLLPPGYSREGIDLLCLIRGRQPDAKVIMMTSKDRGTVEVTADAMRLGAHFFLDKQSGVFAAKMVDMIHDAASARRKRVFLSHGRNDLLRLRLKDFLLTRLALDTVVLRDFPGAGLTVVEKLERAAERCFFAIILMTRDDEQADGNLRARQNVIHELGFFQGKYGRQNVVLLVERGVELFSNISGIVRLEFDVAYFETVFDDLRREAEVALRSL